MRIMLIIGFLSTLLAAPALAQQNCRSLDEVVSLARDKYHEQLTMRAISQKGYMLMLFATEDGQTWTLFGLLPDGQTACMLDAGEGLQRIVAEDQPAPEEGL
jgi:hypothetical protein